MKIKNLPKKLLTHFGEFEIILVNPDELTYISKFAGNKPCYAHVKPMGKKIYLDKTREDWEYHLWHELSHVFFFWSGGITNAEEFAKRLGSFINKILEQLREK